MSLVEEKFNLGMTLWHELAHVFHIQLSRSRVPRWFTEGLAEYETEHERPEWSREHDPALFAAWRDHRGAMPSQRVTLATSPVNDALRNSTVMGIRSSRSLEIVWTLPDMSISKFVHACL
jgi:hypothetical protein